jgi:type VI secretion system protein ImpA
MSELEEFDAQADRWLLPVDSEAPAGPDLEYDNAFLALSQAAAGKPESQFGPAEPPEWPAVREAAAELLDRSRDVRVGMLWLRAGLRMHGLMALPSGLKLLHGWMTGELWPALHPLPDPDDRDPYGRVNALTLLRENEGVVGDLRAARVFADRSIGEVTVRAIELSANLGTPAAGESPPTRATLEQMMAAGIAKRPELRDAALQAQATLKALGASIQQQLGDWGGPDLKPLATLLNAVVAIVPMPVELAGTGEGGEGEGADGEAGSGGGGAAPRRGLSGSVTTREDALKAIDLVIAYMETAEPTNPAPLFLRRARQLVNHNFLQLMKVLAPDALGEVARIVGVDPDSVETPGGP